MRIGLIGLWLLLVSLGTQATPLPLTDLLTALAQSPYARSQDAQQQLLLEQYQQRQQEGGWQWFSAAALGKQNELVQEGNDYGRDSYENLTVAIGLRHPLLGTLKRHRETQATAERELARHSLESQLRLAEQRLALRTAYADWWRASRESAVCTELVNVASDAQQKLAQRQRQGWLLNSEARLQIDQWHVLKRRCQRAERLQTQTRELVALLSGRAVAAHMQAEADPVFIKAKPFSAWQTALKVHPQYRQQQGELAFAERFANAAWYEAIDANFAISQNLETRPGASQHGDGLVASLNVSSPFDVMGYGASRRSEKQARMHKAQAELEIIYQQLQVGLGQVLSAYQLAMDELITAHDELSAAELVNRERKLRANAELEQSWLGVWEAELAWQKARLHLVEVWHNAWRSEAALRVYTEMDASLAPLLGSEQLHWSQPIQAQRTWRQGVYVWDSERLLDTKTRMQELQRLQRANMQRIYLGVSAKQLSDLAHLKNALRQTLKEAEGQSLEVALLLGDPAWIKSSNRHELLALVTKLRDLPFHALHLDLEVEQLGWPVPPEHVNGWLETLSAIKAVSPWPLELSSHHRWFGQMSSDYPCVPCQLPEIGVRQVSLMIYTKNSERSGELAEDIARRWPALTFRLAQSVEPQLNRDETWHGTGMQHLNAQVKQWQMRLATWGVAGVDWQEWNYYPLETL